MASRPHWARSFLRPFFTDIVSLPTSTLRIIMPFFESPRISNYLMPVCHLLVLGYPFSKPSPNRFFLFTFLLSPQQATFSRTNIYCHLVIPMALPTFGSFLFLLLASVTFLCLLWSLCIKPLPTEQCSPSLISSSSYSLASTASTSPPSEPVTGP